MKKDDFTKAYNYSCLLLKYRDRAEIEIIHRLKKRNFSEEIINLVIKKLKETNFINEKSFIQSFISQNLKKGKSLKLILHELKMKYNLFPDKTMLENFNTNNKENIINIIKKKFNKKIFDTKTLNKLQNFLLRKGYDYQEIKSLLETIIKNPNTGDYNE